MSRNEDVTTGIWVDLMDLTPDAKLLYLWSFTNEHNGMSGIYKIHEAIIGVETGLGKDRITAGMRELADADFAFYVDGVMFVRTRLKRLRTKSQQIATSAVRDVLQVRADHPLRIQFLEVYGREKWLRGALQDANLVSLNRTSGEAHESTDKQGDSLSLTRTSLEVPLSGLSSSSSSTDNDEGEGQNHARTLSALFDYWRERCGHSKAKFTPERRRKLDARLKEGYSEDQIRQGIDGAALNPPRSDDGVVHDDLVSICRNGAQLERYIARATTSRPAAVSHLPEYQRATPEHQAQLMAHVANPGPEPEWLQGATERMQADLAKRRAAG